MIETKAATRPYRYNAVCRSCLGWWPGVAGQIESGRTSVLDLGDLAISDFVTDPAAPVDRAPLELVQCPACGLVQLSASVDRDRLYREYWYRSGVNETMVAALRDCVAAATAAVPLVAGDAVLDIGCNDGTLLDQYPDRIRTVGIDPAGNFLSSDTSRHWLLTGYWPPTDFNDQQTFLLGDQHPFKHIHSIACFYDTDEPDAFVAAIKRHLAPDGVWVLQMAMLEDMLATGGVDNICHEHVCYWSMQSLTTLLDRHRLVIWKAERVPINGGSWRFLIRDYDALARVDHNVSKTQTLAGDLQHFATLAHLNRDRTRDLIFELQRQGKSIYGYAASTKANTLWQFYRLDHKDIIAIAERSPEKIGRFTAATNIPIWSEEQVRAAKPDYLFIGAWQFTDHFIQRERALLEAGTRFIVPLPTLRVFGKEVL